MMTKQTEEALKMAIEALDRVAEYLAGDEQFNFDIYKIDKAYLTCKEALEQSEQEVKCNPHPDAPHGFMRDESHSQDRYVCECEYWTPPAQEPVALVIEDKLADWSKPYVAVKWNKVDFEIGTKFYTHPALVWQGLSDDEILEIDKSIDPELSIGKGKTLFARAIEQALKEKNT